MRTITGMARRMAWVLALVAVAALTSACSPERVFLTAVYGEGQGVAALIHGCGDKPVTGVTVRDVSWRYRSASATRSVPATPSPTVTEGDYWYASRSGAARGDVSVRLLGTPSGWERAEISDLDEFRNGRTYEAISSTNLDEGVEFTLANVASLRSGQVWYRGAATTRDDFLRRAEQDCKKL